MAKRLLLVAYACEPGKGSEPNVGWNWAVHLSRYYKVTLLTRANNRLAIESVHNDDPNSNLSFVYFDIPCFKAIKKMIPFGVQLYSVIWELFCLRAVTDFKFDLVQRLTMVSLASLFPYRKCKTLSIAGFYSGGDRSPSSLRSHYRIKYKIFEFFRSLFYHFITRTVLKNKLRGTSAVLAVTEATLRLLKRSLDNTHVELFPAIGVDQIKIMNHSKCGLSEFQILYGGEIKYHKNLDLLIRAFDQSGLGREDVQFSIVGDGPDKKKLKRLVKKLNCTGVRFIPFIDRESYLDILNESHVFVFAASRDSGGLALLEAVERGIPVIFLNTGGPAEMFRGISYSLKVDPVGSYDDLVCELSNRLLHVVKSYQAVKKEYGPVRGKILNNYLWQKKAEHMVQFHEKLWDENSSGS